MRGYECYLYYKNKEDKLELISNTACFAGLNSCQISYSDVPADLIEKYNVSKNSSIRMYFYGSVASNSYAKWIHFNELSSEPGYIYISQFEQEETSEFVENVVKIINDITECSIVTINDVSYIKYKLLSTYDQNLVLLNFIRNLWHSPITANYSLYFFKTLKKLRSKDRLSRLTKANVESIKINNITGSTGHSNIQRHDLLKIKKKEQLLNYKGCSTAGFLTEN